MFADPQCHVCDMNAAVLSLCNPESQGIRPGNDS
jgi:hypothetical protein